MEDSDEIRKRWLARKHEIGREAFIDELCAMMQAILDHKPVLKDVHTEHCCGEHKVCKYGEEQCSVATGQKLASFPCNCEHM